MRPLGLLLLRYQPAIVWCYPQMFFTLCKTSLFKVRASNNPPPFFSCVCVCLCLCFLRRWTMHSLVHSLVRSSGTHAPGKPLLLRAAATKIAKDNAKITCSVHGFNAPEGSVFLPQWLCSTLKLKKGAKVAIFCMCVCVCMCVHAYVCVCMRVYVYACVCVRLAFLCQCISRAQR